MSSQAPNRWFVLSIMMFAFFPIVLDLTILHVAIPSLTLALKATGSQVLWVIDIYPLLMAGLLIPMGALADRVGHRQLFILGVAIFALSSLLAALASDASLLIVARALKAVGAAMVMPSTLAILRQTFKDDTERATALGIWGSVGSAGAAVGPLAGGALLECFWWGSVFLVSVPFLVIVIILSYCYLPRSSVLNKNKWPLQQALILIAGLMLTIYALKAFFKDSHSLYVTLLLIIIGISLLAHFVNLQRKTAQPMLDISLFSMPIIRIGVLMALMVMGSLAGVELLLAQELQFVTGRTAFEAGLFMLPLMAASAIGGPLTGVILKNVGLRRVASFSLALCALSIAGLALSDFTNATWIIALLLVCFGLSIGVGLTASSVAIMSSTSEEKAGSAGAIEATSYDLGTGLGIAGFGILLSSTYQKTINLPDELPNDIKAQASRSIGETYLAAEQVSSNIQEAMISSAKVAFSASHSSVLLTASCLLALLSLYAFILLGKHKAFS